MLPTKDELLDGMVDIVFSEIDFPSPTVDWKGAMRQRGISAREALRRHLDDRAHGVAHEPGSGQRAPPQRGYGLLREAGFSFREAVHAYSVLDSYTYGFALQEKTIPFQTPEESAQMAKVTVGERGAQYPYLAEVVVELGKSGYDHAEEFEFGLDLILDGLDRYLGG